MPVEKICKRCGKKFYVSPCYAKRGAKYCSPECYRPPTYAICEICGEKFRIRPNRKNSARYCSIECYNLAGRQGRTPYGEQTPRIVITCKNCGKKVRLPENKPQEFCSHSCAAQYRNFGQVRRIDRVEMTCETCGKSFEIYPRIAPKRQFCSKECQFKSRAPSDIEQMVMNELDKRCIEYEYEFSIGPWSIDIAFPDQKIAIELDGVYWHSLPGIKEKDGRKDNYLTKRDWIVLRFPGNKIRESLGECMDKITDALNNRNSGTPAIDYVLW